MHRCKDSSQAANSLPYAPLKNPNTAATLVALAARNTHWAANCFRVTAGVVMAGAMYFDGFSLWAQALNVLAIAGLVGAAMYLDEASSIAYQLAEREERGPLVVTSNSSANVTELHPGLRKSQQAIDDAWDELHAVKIEQNMSLADAVQQVVKERDAAWAELDYLQNQASSPTPLNSPPIPTPAPVPAPVLQVVQAQRAQA